MLNIINKTPRPVKVSLWDAKTKKSQDLEIPTNGYCYPTGSDKITHVKFEGSDWIPIHDEVYSIYRDGTDRLQLTKGADFCKQCLDRDGIPSSSFTNMRCDRCGEKTVLRKKGERVALEVGAATALAVALAIFSNDD
jgi:hypothetical protein